MLTCFHTTTPFDVSEKRSLLKTLWEKEKLFVQAISPFPTMFSTVSKTEIIIFVTFNLSSANAVNLVWSKILLCGNGLSMQILTLYHTILTFNNPVEEVFEKHWEKITKCW